MPKTISNTSVKQPIPFRRILVQLFIEKFKSVDYYSVREETYRAEKFERLYPKIELDNKTNIIEQLLEINYSGMHIAGYIEYNFEISPLTWAVQCNNGPLILTLLNMGADINERNNKGQTAFHFATDEKTRILLLQRGAVDYSGATAKRFVSFREKLQKLSQEKGIRSKTNIIAQLQKINYSKEHVAAYIQNNFEVSPLMWAVECNKGSLILALLNMGADINERNPKEKPALFFARDEKTFKLLLKHGANVNLQDSNRRTPLFFIPNIDMFNLFVKNGANLTHLDVYGKSAIAFLMYGHWNPSHNKDAPLSPVEAFFAFHRFFHQKPFQELIDSLYLYANLLEQQNVIRDLINYSKRHLHDHSRASCSLSSTELLEQVSQQNESHLALQFLVSAPFYEANEIADVLGNIIQGTQHANRARKVFEELAAKVIPKVKAEFTPESIIFHAYLLFVHAPTLRVKGVGETILSYLFNENVETSASKIYDLQQDKATLVYELGLEKDRQLLLNQYNRLKPREISKTVSNLKSQTEKKLAEIKVVGESQEMRIAREQAEAKKILKESYTCKLRQITVDVTLDTFIDKYKEEACFTLKYKASRPLNLSIKGSAVGKFAKGDLSLGLKMPDGKTVLTLFVLEKGPQNLFHILPDLKNSTVVIKLHKDTSNLNNASNYTYNYDVRDRFVSDKQTKRLRSPFPATKSKNLGIDSQKSKPSFPAAGAPVSQTLGTAASQVLVKTTAVVKAQPLVKTSAAGIPKTLMTTSVATATIPQAAKAIAEDVKKTKSDAVVKFSPPPKQKIKPEKDYFRKPDSDTKEQLDYKLVGGSVESHAIHSVSKQLLANLGITSVYSFALTPSCNKTDERWNITPQLKRYIRHADFKTYTHACCSLATIKGNHSTAVLFDREHKRIFCIDSLGMNEAGGQEASNKLGYTKNEIPAIKDFKIVFPAKKNTPQQTHVQHSDCGLNTIRTHVGLVLMLQNMEADMPLIGGEPIFPSFNLIKRGREELIAGPGLEPIRSQEMIDRWRLAIQRAYKDVGDQELRDYAMRMAEKERAVAATTAAAPAAPAAPR